jgi:hypothetical protein
VVVEFRYVSDKNYGWSFCVTKYMYKIFDGNVVAVAFENVFYLKIH